MAIRPAKNQNVLNRWLNSYFSAVIAAVLVLFLLVSYFVLLGPKLRKTEEAIRANLEQQQNIHMISRRKLANLEALDEMYSKINPADLQKFNAVLPDDYPPEKLFGEMEEIISRGGWFISNIALNDIEEQVAPAAEPVASDLEATPPLFTGSGDENLGRINIEMTINAIDYGGFKNLVKMLESNLRLFDITKLSFSPSEGTATFVLTTYYYKNAL